jgi:hypothetical protein
MTFQAVGVAAARPPAGASTTPFEPRQSWRERAFESAARGVLGAMAMTGMRRLSTGLGLVERTPPRTMAEEAPLFRGILNRLPGEYRDEAIEFAHWSYGAVGGIGYAVLPERIRTNRWSGVAYGLGVWAVFETALVPLLVLEAQKKTVVSRVMVALDHALYGVTLGGPPWRARV